MTRRTERLYGMRQHTGAVPLQYSMLGIVQYWPVWQTLISLQNSLCIRNLGVLILGKEHIGLSFCLKIIWKVRRSQLCGRSRIKVIAEYPAEQDLAVRNIIASYFQTLELLRCSHAGLSYQNKLEFVLHDSYILIN